MQVLKAVFQGVAVMSMALHVVPPGLAGVGEPGGVRARAGTLHAVTVGNNFFSPAHITIDIGDSVRWSNGFGFHNVYSCNASQIGCEGEAATELFGSGPGANGPWTYTHTFKEPGSNRYLCQPHASFMWGSVTVRAAGTAPPAVPAGGSAGNPLKVDRGPGADAPLILDWDTRTCLARDYLIVYGAGRGLPTSLDGSYRVRGSVCGVGPEAPFAWEGAPGVASGEFLWWMVVAFDGEATEGSWGHNSSGERAGPGEGGASGRCGVAVKSLANTCGQ